MDHGGDGLITPFPRDTGRLVLAVDDRGRELRLHEVMPGYWQAFRWHEMWLGWCGSVAYGLTPREWTAVSDAVSGRGDQ